MKPKLNALAEGCQNGACNLYALINSLSEAIKEEEHPGTLRDNPAMPVILGHFNSLVGQGIGPDWEKVEEWEKWRAS